MESGAIGTGNREKLDKVLDRVVGIYYLFAESSNQKAGREVTTILRGQ